MEPSYLKPIYVLSEDDELVQRIYEQLRPYRICVVSYVSELAIASMREVPSVLIIDTDHLGVTGLDSLAASSPNFSESIQVIQLNSDSDQTKTSMFGFRETINLHKNQWTLLRALVGNFHRRHFEASTTKDRSNVS